MPDIAKYRALIRAAESRFFGAWSAYCAAHADLLAANNNYMEEYVPSPEDKKSLSTNPEPFEQGLAVAHAAFIIQHPEFPAIEAEGIEIHVRRGDELQKIKEGFLDEGGDEVSFRVLHESVLEGGGASKVIVPNPPSP